MKADLKEALEKVKVTAAEFEQKKQTYTELLKNAPNAIEAVKRQGGIDKVIIELILRERKERKNLINFQEREAEIETEIDINPTPETQDLGNAIAAASAKYATMLKNTIMISHKEYRMFLAEGKLGQDALQLYLHYYATGLNQKTGKPWSNDKYCYGPKGLAWNKDRYYRAKKFLIQKELIWIEKRRDEKTKKFMKGYIGIRKFYGKEKINEIFKPMSSDQDKAAVK